MKRIKKLNLVLTGIIVGMFVSITVGVLATKTESFQVPYEQLQAFSDVYVRIKQIYVDEVDDKELFTGAIRGMLSGLDPHSNYLDVEQFEEMREGTTGKFGGLGIEITMEEGFVKVVSPIDDTPAARAGMQSGDFIVRIDETPVKGLTLSEAVELLRGEPGTSIELTVLREEQTQPLVVSLMRELIKVSSVRQRMVDGGIGYVRIANFTSSTVNSLADAIYELENESSMPLYGLVLDLRRNPGGVLSGAVGVADIFLDSGLIVYTEGRMVGTDKYHARQGDLLKGAPMVVLIDSGSASASEIVAGALQDHNRAVIMGTTSFGKGSVQTIQDLPDGSGLKLTTARYFTPSGRSIQATGIEPDIDLSGYELNKLESSQFEPVREGDLSGHLQGDEEASEVESTEIGQDPIGQDYWLFQAVNLIKGLNIADSEQK